MALVVTLTSCSSSHLTRSAAKSCLEGQGWGWYFHHKTEQSILIGKVSPSCCEVYDVPVSSIIGNLKALQTAGYLTVTSEGPEVWNIALTEMGNKATTAPGLHTQNGICDYWHSAFVFADFDHYEITSILEVDNGLHAEVRVNGVFKLTQLGDSLRKQASVLHFDDRMTRILLGTEIADMPKSAMEYREQATILFDKYNDGWDYGWRIRDPCEGCGL